MWDDLNKIINGHNITNYGQPCNMSEDTYQEFIRQISKNNKNIITEK